MFRAVLRKEWRQLRLLRRVGIALGALIPPMLLAAAEAGRQGWSLFGTVSNYSAATVIQEAVPSLLGTVVWPLIGLLVASQAFSADRAAGTEAFTLQRPVRRRLVWGARLAAATATAIAVCAGQLAIWWALTRVVGDPQMFDAVETTMTLLGRGSLLTVIAVLAGAGAGAFVGSPIQALLLGLVFLSLPLGFGALLGGVFPWARLGWFRVGHFVPVILVLGYGVASYLMFCRGEPAGRGRVTRGIVILAAVVFALPLTFVGSAPFVLRLDARLGIGNTTVLTSPAGDAAFVRNKRQFAGWLIELPAGEPLRFFPPPVFDAAWDDDGGRVAVFHSGGSLGEDRATGRIEVFDRSGEAIGSGFDVPPGRFRGADDIAWAGDNLLVESILPGSAVEILDLRTGKRRRAELDWPPGSWSMLDPTAEGDVFVAWFGRTGRHPEKTGSLRRLDLVNGKFGPEIAVHDTLGRWYAETALSPSGSLWLSRDNSASARVEDLSGAVPIEVGSGHSVWLAGDVLASSSKGRVLVGPPGQQRVIRDEPGRTWHRLQVSPDRTTLLIDAVPRGVASRREVWVYDTRSAEVQRIAGDPGLPGWPPDVYWGGTSTLVWVGNGYLAVQDLTEDGPPRLVLGRRTN